MGLNQRPERRKRSLHVDIAFLAKRFPLLLLRQELAFEPQPHLDLPLVLVGCVIQEDNKAELAG